MLAGRATHLPAPDATAVLRGFKIRAAESARERGSANALIQRMYSSRGYQAGTLPEVEPAGLKTFLASDHNEPIGTLSIHLDTSAGLAADDNFAAETGQIRATGRRVCEFTKLAMSRHARSPRLLASLFHVAYVYAHRINAVDDLLIEVNPRHVRYYQQMLEFRVVGPRRHNARVDAPAVLMALDLHHARQRIERFGGRPEMAATERSAYPHFFSHADELGILGRLQRRGEDVAHVKLALPGARTEGEGNSGELH